MNIRTFIGGIITPNFQEICQRSHVNEKLMKEDLIDEIKARAETYDELAEYDLIKQVYTDFEASSNIKSHSAALFQKKLSTLCKILKFNRRELQLLETSRSCNFLAKKSPRISSCPQSQSKKRFAAGDIQL